MPSLPSLQIFQSNNNTSCYITSYLTDVCRISPDSADLPPTRDEKMAPRNFKNCDHTETNHPTCPACIRKIQKAERAKKAAEAEAKKKLARERKAESRRKFKRDVKLEFDFMKSLGAYDTSARKKAEKERAVINRMIRDTERKYVGPLIFNDEIREQEKQRLIKLRKKFKKADARWTLVREEAELKFFAWANNELETMLQVKRDDLDMEHAILDVAYLEVVDKMAEREFFLEKINDLRKAGNGN